MNEGCAETTMQSMFLVFIVYIESKRSAKVHHALRRKIIKKINYWSPDRFMESGCTNTINYRTFYIATMAEGKCSFLIACAKLTLTFLLFRKQSDHPDRPPAEPVRPGGALPAGHGQTLEVPGHGAGGLSQRQPLP